MTGPAFILAFVVLSAFRDVFFAETLRSAPLFAVALVAFTTKVAWPWYAVVGSMTTLVVGLSLSDREIRSSP